MIHHISFSARDPARAASVLAEVVGGTAFPFPPHPGSFITLSGDPHGTAIEVYPLGTMMRPGEGDGDVRYETGSSENGFIANHTAISVAMNEAGIKEIAEREGWRAVTCDRGGLFQVVEFWLENRVLIEFLTPEMAEAYLRNITPSLWAESLSHPSA
jgi:hypothetical protein